MKGSRVLILGLTFKENVPDIRNSKVIDIVRELREYEVEAVVCDPLADPAEARHEYGLDLVTPEGAGDFDAIVWAVAHEAFKAYTPARLKRICCNGNGKGVVMDVKSTLRRDQVEAEGMLYWRL